MNRRWTALPAAAALLVALAAPARAFDPAQIFKMGTFVFSLEGAGGTQFNLEGHERQSGLDFIDFGARFSILPFGPTGPGPLWGAFELGVEPLFQWYVNPENFIFGGATAVGRYHFLSLGRFVPYAELGAGAGITNLRVKEIESTFTFLLFGGLGAEVFVTDTTAFYAGYRLQHVSNGNTSQPNRGFESHTGVAGVSWYFP